MEGPPVSEDKLWRRSEWWKGKRGGVTEKLGGEGGETLFGSKMKKNPL